MNSGNDVFENKIPNLLVAYVAYVKLFHDTFSVFPFWTPKFWISSKLLNRNVVRLDVDERTPENG